MKTKIQYRIRNWREYNAALVNRGSLTLWVDEEAIRVMELQRGYQSMSKMISVINGLADTLMQMV